MSGAFVYILRCADGAYYTGLTHRSPEERESEHNQGVDPKSWTFARRPVALIWAAHFDNIIEAIETERRIKGWRREKKDALIRGEFDALPALASRRKG